MLAIVDECVNSPPIVGELHAEDNVGIIDGGRGTPEVMGIGEVHPAALVDHDRLQGFSQLHQQQHAILGARQPIDHDDRVLSIGQKPSGLLDRSGIPLRRSSRHVAGDVQFLAVALNRLLLQTRIEGDCNGSIGRRHGNLVGAHEGLREMLQRDRRVIPLGVIAHQGVNVLRRVDGRHAGRPMCCVELVAADDNDGDPIAPRVVDCHCGVLQAHRAVAERHQRLASDLEITVRDGNSGFFMRAGEEFRGFVAAVIDK